MEWGKGVCERRIRWERMREHERERVRDGYEEGF